jgi:hypothetical protein
VPALVPEYFNTIIASFVLDCVHLNLLKLNRQYGATARSKPLKESTPGWVA